MLGWKDVVKAPLPTDGSATNGAVYVLHAALSATASSRRAGVTAGISPALCGEKPEKTVEKAKRETGNEELQGRRRKRNRAERNYPEADRLLAVMLRMGEAMIDCGAEISPRRGYAEPHRPGLRRLFDERFCHYLEYCDHDGVCAGPGSCTQMRGASADRGK